MHQNYRLKAKILSTILAASLIATSGISVLAADRNDWVNSMVLGRVSVETPVNIKDDFALAVNKEAIVNAEIPAGKSGTGGVYNILGLVDEQLLALIDNETLGGHDAEIVNTVSDIYMDWDSRDALGVTPIMDSVAAIQNMNCLADVYTFMFDPELNYYGLGMPVISVSTALDYPDYYTVYVDDLQLVSNYFFSYDSDERDYYREIFEAPSVYMLERIGYAEADAREIYAQEQAFEDMLTAHMYTTEQKRQSDFTSQTNNPCTQAQLLQMTSSYPMEQVLAFCGVEGSDSYVVTTPGLITSLPDIWCEENVDLIRSYLMVNFLMCNIMEIDSEAYDTFLEFCHEINGSNYQTESDAQRLLRLVKNYAPNSLDNLYITVYGSAQAKEEITEICEEVIAYYKAMLENVDWLDDSTRARAMSKLDSLIVHSCYPDELHDTSAYTAEGIHTTIDYNKMLHAASVKTNAALINTKYDRTKWNDAAHAYAVNASYHDSANSIYILQGILSSPVYDESMSREQKLAGIGTIIGHEISHAFDDYGAQYNEVGGYEDWFTENDKIEYAAATTKLIDYYDSLEVDCYDEDYDGWQVRAEAVADITGMKAILSIAATEENFDYDQFFRQYAALWSVVYYEGYMYYLAKYDSHPLGYLRVNVILQQFDEFLETYDIAPGDGMYLAPEDRILVW